MATECSNALKNSNKNIADDIGSYSVKVKAAVRNIIGSPSRSKIVNLKKAIRSTNDPKLTSTYKRHLKMEQDKYKDHNRLYDYMVDYLMESGRLTSYDAIPQDMADAWHHYFSRFLHGHISPVSIKQGTRRIKSIYNRVKAVDKARKKMLARGKLLSPEIALYTPDMIMMKADRFGIVSKVINGIKTVTDNEIQMQAKFTKRFTDSLSAYSNTLKNHIAGVDRLVDINNSAMDGLVGFNIKKNTGLQRTGLTGGQDVRIMGDGVYNGVPSWKVQIRKSQDEISDEQENAVGAGADPKTVSEWTSTTHWIPKTELHQNTSDVYDALILKYRDELLNDILHGQVRYLVPQTVPPRDDQLNWIDENGLFYIRKIQEMGLDTGTIRKTPAVHTIIKGGWTYTYTMKKQGELSQGATPDQILNGERYFVYLLQKQKGDKIVQFKDKPYSQDEINRLFKEGFYKSATEYNYGKVVNRGDKKAYQGSDKRYIDFKFMDNQPNSIALNVKVSKTLPDESYNSFWDTVAEMRGIYSDIYDDVDDRVKNFTVKMLRFRESSNKVLKHRGMTEEQIDKFWKNFERIGGIKSKIWSDPGGGIWSINSFMKKKRYNYAPTMFESQQLDELVDFQVAKLKTQLIRLKRAGVNTEEHEGKIKKVEDALGHLEAVQQYAAGGESDENSSRLIAGEKMVHLKHLTDWTDGTKRKKDGDVHFNYLKRMYMLISRNDLMMDATESIYKLVKVEKQVPTGTLDYLINRLKIGVGESDTRALNVFGKDRGYKVVAQRLNKIPKKMRMGVEFTPESAESITKWLGTFPTMRFLGASSALGNRTQIINMIIAEGVGTWQEAYKWLDSSDDNTRAMAKAIVDNTGVLNLLSMFQEIMTQDGDVEWNKFAFFPGTLIPAPSMVEFVRLLAKGRQSFIQNKSAYMDNFLTNLYLKSKGKERADLKHLMALEGERKRFNNFKEEKKGLLYDIYTAEEGKQSQKLMEARMRNLIGKMSEDKLKQMVSWKLSFWFDKTKGAFTFTEGERELRSQTAIMALIGAYKRGLLGGNPQSVQDMSDVDISIFMTPKAVKIARDAVYNTQFGMTPVYLGEGFNGFGRALWQYKSYPTQQMSHDYKIIRKFMDGHKGEWGQSISRLTIAAADATKRMATTGKYDPGSEYLDHEALAVNRLIFTRVLASVIASAIGLAPVISWALRKVGAGGFTWSLMRSAENPALGLAMRSIMWFSLTAMGADEEGEEALDDLLGGAQYLLLPVWIGMLIRDGVNVVGAAEDWF